MAHGSVEQELDATPRPIIRHIKFQPIPAYADKGQATRPAGVLHGFFLPVLGDGNVLPVVQITERPRDGPVVRHTDTRPVPVVVSGGHTGRVVLMGETPTRSRSVSVRCAADVIADSAMPSNKRERIFMESVIVLMEQLFIIYSSTIY